MIAIRWPMMLCIAILGISLVSDLFPDPAQPMRIAEMIKAAAPTSEREWSAEISRIAFNPSADTNRLRSELERELGPQWQPKLLLVSYHGTIDPERIMPAVLFAAIPPGFRSLILVSLLAAAMATASAWINQASGFFVRDIYQKHLRPTRISRSYSFRVGCLSFRSLASVCCSRSRPRTSTTSGPGLLWDWAAE